MSNSLDQLKATGTVVVSDSGDFECKYADWLNFRPDSPHRCSYRCLQAPGNAFYHPAQGVN